jgi:hypothetical protein
MSALRRNRSGLIGFSIPIVEARRRAISLRRVGSTGAKTARNTSALHAEMTPRAGGLATAAVAITGPFSDAAL